MTAPVRVSAASFAAVSILLAASLAQAQVINPGPPGPFVIDLRGATSGVPSAGEFYPAITDDPDDDQELTVPARGFGFEVGAHVYPFRLGPARVGFGLSVMRVRATAVSALPAGESEEDEQDTDGNETPVPVDVVATGQTLAPQVSFNFGTSNGWSYLSLGYGRVAIRTRVDTDEHESEGLTALNVGGGARWFFTDHLGVGFDVRWHRVGAGDATPRTTMFAAVVGLSVK